MKGSIRRSAAGCTADCPTKVPCRKPSSPAWAYRGLRTMPHRLASSRQGHLTSATKSNGIVHTMPFWDEVVEETTRLYPDVTLTSELVDALAAHLVLKPWTFDVIVASNLLGDILSDLGSSVTGSIGVAPSANLNPEGDFPSLFEPVHGSAPDIAGKGLANPVGQIWSGAMMLEHLGHPEAARAPAVWRSSQPCAKASAPATSEERRRRRNSRPRSWPRSMPLPCSERTTPTHRAPEKQGTHDCTVPLRSQWKPDRD